MPIHNAVGVFDNYISTNGYYNNTFVPNTPTGTIQTMSDGRSYVWDGSHWTTTNAYQPSNGYYNSNWYDQFGYKNNVLGQNSVTPEYCYAISSKGNTFNVGDTLQRIVDLLTIITPDSELMDKYPAVKEAYDNYETIFSDQFKQISDAVDSYNTVVKLARLSDNEDNRDE